MGSSRWPLKVRLHLSISTALMRPRRPKQYCLQLYIYIYIYIYVYMAGLSYHICGKLEVAFKGSPSSQHQHCTDEVQKAETVLSAVSYIHIYIYNYIALWCKNQIEHSIWDESLLLCICACSLEYSSSSTLAGLSYHICGKLEVAFKASPSLQHQH